MATCRDCDCETENEEDNYEGENAIICEDCAQYYEWCEVCQTCNFAEGEDPCRHMFWGNNREGWGGCGTHSHNNHTSEKADFSALLSMIGIESAKQLKQSLELHKYYFQFRGSTFGVEHVFANLFNADGEIKYDGNYYWDKLNQVFDIKDEKLQEPITASINWLMSLWSGSSEKWEIETEAADLKTAKWITEWLDAQIV